jgi:hypothetical protein
MVDQTDVLLFHNSLMVGMSYVRRLVNVYTGLFASNNGPYKH